MLQDIAVVPLCAPRKNLISFSRNIVPYSVLSSNLLAKVQINTAASAHSDHNHSKIWTAERFLSAGLVGLLPLSLAYPAPALDYALAVALTAHVHWGIEAIAVDYVRPSIVGATLSKAAVAVVYSLSVFMLGGLFYFNYNDIGLCQAIRMLWKL
ncbi:succinate dehydrogenase [ubiquinone] cytochrome b small subunit, mitochondrial-like [Stegodyphus dumicola]|uniref:succinate dehydrogenase [ubiquinone] cytochrome b small subunit, mitochondrial-like n=1 Tax=Stegodyphus dumicola TaxID=202533 RepID=UPI0015B0433A|nr:succinate dehydrogenase [ubiquinone] cytochrome b small subunit, mitochondrial-like [Stegodyphus dumicola]